MLNEISLSPEIYQEYQIDKDPPVLSNLNKINIFIGPNNSGKSRFMRKLFMDEKSAIGIYRRDFKAVIEEIKNQTIAIRTKFDTADIQEFNETYSKLTSLPTDSPHFKLENIKETIRKIREVATYLAETESIGSMSRKPHIIRTGNGERFIPNKVASVSRSYKN